MEVNSFTIKANGIANAIITECEVFPSFNPAVTNPATVKGVKFKAIWDTGATKSVISKNVVDALGLSNMGFVPVNHAGGQDVVPVYKVNIGLPNRVAIAEIKVSEGKIASADVLIGMDIITMGDFSLTNFEGKTIMSFRMPSIQKVDYVEETELLNKYQRIHVLWAKHGNNKCPCGSSKTWEKCHGKNLV
jgi:hypothetical protein